MAFFFFKRMDREEAHGVVKEFMADTPLWLESTRRYHSDGKGCVLCGMKAESITKLLEALGVIFPELKQK